DLEIGVPERVGQGPVAQLGESNEPAGLVGMRRRDGQRVFRAFAIDLRAAPKAILGTIGEDLNPDGAAQTVNAADAADGQPLADAHPTSAFSGLRESRAKPLRRRARP